MGDFKYLNNFSYLKMFLLIQNTLIIAILFEISFIKCQQQESNHSIVELNKQYNGSLKMDFTYAFFKLLIPEGV